MKKVIIVCYTMLIAPSAFSQSITQIDSLNVSRLDYILKHKDCYLGGSLEELLFALNLNVGFSQPDNLGPKSRGKIYYQKLCLYLPWKSGVPLRSFHVTIARQVQVWVYEYRQRQYDEWDIKMRKLLGKEIVTSISK
jgi:hypothetical protein